MKTALFFAIALGTSLLETRAQTGPPPEATKEHPWENTLGIKFVPVPGTQVLFAIHDTRNRDYAPYAEANPEVKPDWKPSKLQIDKGLPAHYDDFPVVNISWDSAKAFCEWLSKKEGRTYRLPTDHEWSCAAGIGDLEDAKATPESKSGLGGATYPWGNQWPPPQGAANLADLTLREQVKSWSWTNSIIEGYRDGFADLSPVMSFQPNTLGLYDMAGNVMQWCEDWANEKQMYKVLRGSTARTYNPSQIRSSNRICGCTRWNRGNDMGFRLVLVQK